MAFLLRGAYSGVGAMRHTPSGTPSGKTFGPALLSSTLGWGPDHLPPQDFWVPPLKGDGGGGCKAVPAPALPTAATSPSWSHHGSLCLCVSPPRPVMENSRPLSLLARLPVGSFPLPHPPNESLRPSPIQLCFLPGSLMRPAPLATSSSPPGM